MKRFMAACLAALAGFPAGAQDIELLIPGVNDQRPEMPVAPVNPMAACFLDAASPQCRLGELGGGNVQFESAVPGAELEVLTFTPGTNKVTVTQEDPPKVDYSAPVTPYPQPSYSDTSPSQAPAVPIQPVPIKLPAVAVTIEFDFDSDRIRADQFGKIAALAAALQDPALAGTSYAVIGHTDAKGSDAYNCDLSRRRAISVAGTLQANLVAVPMIPLGMGEVALKNAFDPNAAENRRVTFMRLPDDPQPILQTATAVCGA